VGRSVRFTHSHILVHSNHLKKYMSLSPKTLSSVQKAGQAVYGASEAVAETVRAQAASLVALVASQPFGLESEQAMARFKSLSRLSQGLAAVEIQLRDLYAMAAELASPASDVVIALPAVSKRTATNAAAVDVVAKPPKGRKTVTQRASAQQAKK
jgi:hypothetical protein